MDIQMRFFQLSPFWKLYAIQSISCGLLCAAFDLRATVPPMCILNTKLRTDLGLTVIGALPITIMLSTGVIWRAAGALCGGMLAWPLIGLFCVPCPQNILPINNYV